MFLFSNYIKITFEFCSPEFTGFNFNVSVSKLNKTNMKWMYTFWHNSFFNPVLNEDIDILYFNPNKSGLAKKD